MSKSLCTPFVRRQFNNTRVKNIVTPAAPLDEPTPNICAAAVGTHANCPQSFRVAQGRLVWTPGWMFSKWRTLFRARTTKQRVSICTHFDLNALYSPFILCHAAAVQQINGNLPPCDASTPQLMMGFVSSTPSGYFFFASFHTSLCYSIFFFVFPTNRHLLRHPSSSHASWVTLTEVTPAVAEIWQS